MRHRNAFHKLGRNPSHRRAVLRNLATSLVLHDSIETTLPKAKALKRVADKLVTLGKTNSLHNKRQAMRYLQVINRKEKGNAQKLSAVHRLFEEIAPRYSERNGGYTRVVRTSIRPGDKAQMALIQFVEEALPQAQPKKRRRRVVKKKETAETNPVEAAAEEVEAEAEVKAEEKKVDEEAASEEESAEEEPKKDE